MTQAPLDLVKEFLRRYVVYPNKYALTAHALWIAHTHLMGRWDTTPRLAFMSAEKESGKTRALEVTALLVSNPILSFDMSPAVIIRMVDEGDRTVLYDEVDALFGSARREEGCADLVAFMNGGYRRGAKAYRCGGTGRNIEPQEFDSFAPIALAGLHGLPDTLASRSIIIRMQRRSPGETVESFRQRRTSKEAKPVRDALRAWSKEIAPNIECEPDLPPSIRDRAADIWEPLIAVADAAGADWPEKARAAAVYFASRNAEDEAMTVGVELLAHIKEAFGTEEKIWTEHLLKKLCSRDESPWADMRGRPLNDRQLAKLLDPYQIKSKDVWIANKTRRGYVKEDFYGAWERYLPALQLSQRDGGDEREEFDNKDKNLADIADLADGARKVADLVGPCDVVESGTGLSQSETEPQAERAFDGWEDMPKFLRRWDGRPTTRAKTRIISDEPRGMMEMPSDDKVKAA